MFLSLGLILTAGGPVAQAGGDAVPGIPGQLLGPLGLLVGALIVVWAVFKPEPLVVPGSQYRALETKYQKSEERNDELYERLLTAAATNLKTAQATERAVDAATNARARRLKEDEAKA